MSKRPIRRRRPPSARRRKPPRGRRSLSTWAALLEITEAPEGFAMDGDMQNAVLYAIGLQVQDRGVSIHGFSFGERSVRVAFTVRGGPDAFLGPLTRDVAGYTDCRFESRGTRVVVAELRATETAEAVIDALAQIAFEGGTTPASYGG